MTIKILLLKSGEDVVADVKEMVSPDDKVIGYFLTKPCIIKLIPKETEGNKKQMTIKILLLKSGEDVVADVKEMVSPDDKVIGYFLTKPCVIKLIPKQ